MEKVRIGVIGLGNMGQYHAQYQHDSAVGYRQMNALVAKSPLRKNVVESAPEDITR